MSMNSQEKIKALEENLSLWQQQFYAYERELAITASAITKFELKVRIKECKQQISRISIEIESIQSGRDNTNLQSIEVNSSLVQHSSESDISRKNQSSNNLTSNNQNIQMDKVTWLHLSDWHQKGQEFGREVVRDKLIDDIKNRIEISPNLATVDFIIFSGDLAHSANPQEYKAAQKYFLEPILKATNLSPDKIFFVPGNHDFDRNEIDFLPAKIQNPFKNENDVTEWLSHERKKNFILEPFKAYREFIKSFNQQNSPEYASIKKLTLNNNTIGLLGINSALMAARNKDSNGVIADKKYLIVGESQVYDHFKSIEDCQIKIAVLHHPFNWLAEFDSKRVKPRLGRGCHFILCGHEHLPEVEINNSTTNGNHVIIPAGASYEQLDYPNSYNFVHLNLERNSGDVYLRKWSRERDEFIKHEEAYKNGQFSIASLPDQLGQLSNSNNSLKAEFSKESRRTDNISPERQRSLNVVMHEVLDRKNSPQEKRDTVVTFLRYLVEQPELDDQKASSILDMAIDYINQDDGRTTKPSTEIDKAFYKVLYCDRFGELCQDRLLQGYIRLSKGQRKAIAGIYLYKSATDTEDLNADNAARILKPLLADLVNLNHDLKDKFRVKAGLNLVEAFFRPHTYSVGTRMDFLADRLPIVINTLLYVLNQDIFSPGDTAISSTAVWALGWLINAKTCQAYRIYRFTPSQLDILIRLVENPKQDSFARGWAALILSVSIPENPTFAQIDWIYEWALVADGAKPQRSLPRPNSSSQGRNAEPAIKVIKKLVTASDTAIETKRQAGIALGRLGYFGSEIVEPLLQAFRNESLINIERDEALVYLVFTQNSQAISALREGMRDKENKSQYGLQEHCFLALISIDDRDALNQRSFFGNNKDQFIAKQGHLIHKLKAKDSTGRWAYYFVYVEPHKEKAFLDALEANKGIDLEDFGKVVGSCYGEQPNDELRVLLKNKYGFDV